MEESTKHENIKDEIKDIIKRVVTVRNYPSLHWRSSSTVANQFIIEGEDFEMFQSYSSPIVAHYKGKTFIFKDWDYSNTTGKYRNNYLGETKKETFAKLKSGEYIAVDFEVEE